MKRLSKNIASLLVSDIARRIFGFLSVAYLARVLGVSLFGTINIGWTALAYGVALSTAGVSTLAARRIASGEGNDMLPDVVGSRIVLSLCVVVCTVVASILLIHDRVTATIISIMSLSAVAQSFWVDWYFQGRELMAPVAWARTLSAGVYFGIILLFVRQPVDLFWVAGAAVIGDVLAADAMIRRLRKEGVEFRVRIRLRQIARLLHDSLPLAIGGMLAYLSLNLPPFILGFTRSSTEVGIYGAASKLVLFLLLGDRILASLLLPASARLFAQSREAVGGILRDAIGWIFVLGLPVAMGGALLAGPLVALVFGDLYTQATIVLRIFVWYFFATMVHTVYTSGLIAVGGEREYGRIMMVTAILYTVSITAGSLLYGAEGAAGAVVVSESISVILLHRALNKHISIQNWMRLVKAMICVLGMAVPVVLLRDQFVLLPILVGVITYGVLITATRTLTKDDVLALRERL
jgi:O-antigen/teichoic acid export membrane protein